MPIEKRYPDLNSTIERGIVKFFNEKNWSELNEIVKERLVIDLPKLSKNEEAIKEYIEQFDFEDYSLMYYCDVLTDFELYLNLR